MIGCVGVHVGSHSDMINLTTLQRPPTQFRMMSLCPRRLDRGEKNYNFIDKTQKKHLNSESDMYKTY